MMTNLMLISNPYSGASGRKCSTSVVGLMIPCLVQHGPQEGVVDAESNISPPVEPLSSGRAKFSSTQSLKKLPDQN